jgi:manganese transport protein
VQDKDVAMRLRSFGPGMLVTAAFIGPGTVTTASRAGSEFGFALLWAVLFATVATIVLQEMSARLGIVGRQGLGEAVRGTFPTRAIRWLAATLVVTAIGLGNAAYQTGNITGAAMALDVLTGWGMRPWSLVVGACAFAALAVGRYKWIERLLITLVVLMSLAFIITAAITRPDPAALFQGSLIPLLPAGSLTTVLGLIGTTIVPYNLFLHASSAREKWPAAIPTAEALRESRRDTVTAVSIGGLITAAIVTTAAAAFFGTQTSPGSAAITAAAMARQLEPMVGGSAATWLFSLGLFAAGLTSAITAPLAAAYAVCGVLNWPVELRSGRFRGVWMVVLLVGVALAVTFGRSPEQTILIAQVANGFLLPLIALFLLLAVNQPSIMGAYANGTFSNLFGGLIVLVVTGLAAYKLFHL